jgi:hypothetical protein
MVPMERAALEQLLALLPESPDDNHLISAITVREELGRISDMNLWRWLHPAQPRDSQERTPEKPEKIPFPQPDFYINGRRYWKRRTLRLHRYRMELEKPHPVKGAASSVQPPRRQTRSNPARTQQEREHHARESE